MTDTPSAGDQSYLGRVFDSYQNMMQIASCLDEAARQRSIANPHVLELSRRATGLEDYVRKARIRRYPTHNDNKPILTDPVTLPFADKSFDCSLVTDVYEHLPAELRPGLLREMLRVTDGLVLIASPQGNEIVTRFDRVVFDFIWGKYAERFEPLEQHARFGLEPLQQILDTLKTQGAERVLALPCNYVYRWIHQILIFFDLQYKHEYWDLFEPLNRIYNERMSPYDYREPCYRYLIAVATSREINVDAFTEDLKGPKETPAIVADTDGVLVQTFRAVEGNLADKLRLCSKERDLLSEDNRWAKREIDHLSSTVHHLEQHSEWAKGEIEHLTSVIRQLQEDNQWATKEIERLSSPPATNGENESSSE